MNDTPKPVKILVVDDNPKNIQVIGTVLREANYEVGFALDGKKALDHLAETQDFDLVLLDIKMPGLNGYEVCNIMKDDFRFKDIPIIFLSASHDTENIITALDIGGVDYVTKPFNGKELLARVHTHLMLKQKTLEVTRYAQALEKLNATKDKFFSIIAHDLRNPFEGILMMSRSMLATLPPECPETVRKHMELIVSASEGGHKLLENLLTWSRSQTGNISFKPAPAEISKLVSGVIDSYTARAVSKGITLAYEPSREKINLETDAGMFNHVLGNLLANAIKFTRPSGTVVVESGITPTGVTVSVTDTGLGISESDLARLFRIDGQIASRRGTANETGSGLGLILCREFLDKMGGTISVESELDKGSRFTFTLPSP